MSQLFVGLTKKRRRESYIANDSITNPPKKNYSVFIEAKMLIYSERDCLPATTWSSKGGPAFLSFKMAFCIYYE